MGTAVSLQISASDSASGQTLTYSASGLPAGLSISSSSGLISGTPTTAGTSSVTVTATDTTGASGSASFTWTISGGGGRRDVHDLRGFLHPGGGHLAGQHHGQHHHRLVQPARGLAAGGHAERGHGQRRARHAVGHRLLRGDVDGRPVEDRD